MNSNDKKPLGTFRDELLYAGARKHALKGNAAAHASVYVEVAEAIMREYPELNQSMRKMQLGIFQHHIEMRRIRTKRDFSYVLPTLARVLNTGVAA